MNPEIMLLDKSMKINHQNKEAIISLMSLVIFLAFFTSLFEDLSIIKPTCLIYSVWLDVLLWYKYLEKDLRKQAKNNQIFAKKGTKQYCFQMSLFITVTVSLSLGFKLLKELHTGKPHGIKIL